MDDDKVGIIPDENLDESEFPMPIGDDDLDEELGAVEELDVLGEAEVLDDVEDGFYFAEGEDEDTVGVSAPKKKRIIDDEESDEFAEDLDEDDDEEEDFYGDEDDEARYNYKADEDLDNDF